ncbi:MAG: PQQ-like beta-propeller repeat protein, partial [Chloroflexi bacterium]|nr:PQQ-like beta-propeller repeat protein [Chloroflexota bacterium]
MRFSKKIIPLIIALALGGGGLWLAVDWLNRPGSVVMILKNPSPESRWFGTPLAGMDNKIIVGASDKFSVKQGQGDGAVYVFDGANGKLLYTIPSPVEGDNRFGVNLAAACGNIFVTGSAIPGGFYLFDGASGALIRRVESPPELLYAYNIAAGGERIVVSGPPNQHQLFIYDAQNGDWLFTLQGPVDEQRKTSKFGDLVATDGKIVATTSVEHTTSVDWHEFAHVARLSPGAPLKKTRLPTDAVFNRIQSVRIEGPIES